jgi:hypothetical protein
MKLIYVHDSFYYWRNGCWLYRNHFPLKALKARGHKVKLVILGTELPEQSVLDFPDTVVFSRTYGIDPIPLMRKWKQMGKKVVYEIDDDLWNVNPDNPSANVSTDMKEQYETMIKEADLVTTTTPYLAKLIKKKNKNVAICPNAVDFDLFEERLHRGDELRIAYTGAASHWDDLSIISEAIIQLQKKYKFLFIVIGMTGSPLPSDLWEYKQMMRMGLQPERKKYFEKALKWADSMKGINWQHEPFWSPMLYPERLKQVDFDIGVAPLHDNKFNHSKSCIKFYEYASVGAVTLASDVLPYNKEVGYCAKNTTKDWYKKLEKLIVDKQFRSKLLFKQSDWVQDHRDIKDIAILWEKALRP